jgi:hypothetical protein
LGVNWRGLIDAAHKRVVKGQRLAVGKTDDKEAGCGLADNLPL